MFELLMSADMMVSDPDAMAELLVTKLGIHKHERWRQAFADHPYIAHFLRVHKSLAVSPTAFAASDAPLATVFPASVAVSATVSAALLVPLLTVSTALEVVLATSSAALCAPCSSLHAAGFVAAATRHAASRTNAML